jgi:hypothetical protein
MLPLYESFIPEDFDDPENERGVSRISLVRSPAIERDFKFFNSHKLPESAKYFQTQSGVLYKESGQSLFTKNDNLQIVAGPVMLADTKIYRRHESGDEYEVVFKAADVAAVEKKFTSNEKYRNAFNLNHLEIPVSAEIQESYISAPNGFTKIMGFEDIPPKSWMLAIYIKNEKEYRDFVVDKFARGFSVEIDLPMRLIAGDAKDMPQVMSSINALIEYATPKSVKEQISNLENTIAFNQVLSGFRRFKNRDQKIANELQKLKAPDGFDYFVKNRTTLQKLIQRYE